MWARRLPVAALLLLVVAFSSCKTQKRVLTNYLEDIRDTSFRNAVAVTEPVIQKNDLLSIQISSTSLNAEVDRDYNLPASQGAALGGQQPGYLVDVHGMIEMPRIGTIRAEGLTKSELEREIKTRLKNVLSGATVAIRFLNFRITVLGEVRSPGILTIPSERLTILEAIGMAGGITDYGTMKQVRVLRENNGTRQSGILDLSSKSIFQSPYYQLQQNDVVLIDQSTYKLQESEQQRTFQRVSFGLAIITSVAVLYNIFKK
ncbi:MAG: polysaccharide export protein [Flaviaesturariibacter sp.]|nr:polysaccharide export protein [Flaviaesturariibacter sp.]